MCRNIKDTIISTHRRPTRGDSSVVAAIRAQAVGLHWPSKANTAAFDEAVDKGRARGARRLIDSLVTDAPPRNREVEAVKARAGVSASTRKPPSS